MPDIQPQNLSPWQQMRINAMYMRDVQAQRQARQQAGQVLYDQMGAQPAVPPPPAQAAPQAPPPGAMSPGGGNPMAQGGASVMAQPQARPQMQPGSAVPPPPMLQGGGMPPPPMQGAQPMQQQPRPAAPMPMAPPQIPPFRPLPAGGQAPAQAAPGQVPPPPAAAAEQPAMAAQPHPLDLKGIIGGLQKSGIKPDHVMDMLEALSPVMNSQNKQELEFFKANNAALKAANDAYAKVMQAQAAATRANTGVDAEARRTTQGDRRLDQGDEKNKIARDKLSRQAGGPGNIKKWEYDPAEPTKVIGGWTASGKHIKLDDPGMGVAGKPGGAGGAQAAVRSNLVNASAKNAINRLDEIEKAYGNEATTSTLFGQEAKGLIENAGHAAVRGMQDKRQQDIDAKWGSFIDEAIPVFTGGLRGSDAFRRFLIAQAPTAGTKGDVVAEKRRLFRENILGTQSVFANKFAADPSMWGKGVKKEEVQAKAGGVDPRGTSALPAGIPQGASVIGKTPDGRDVYKAPDGKNYTAN